jgi:hypothetical protein
MKNCGRVICIAEKTAVGDISFFFLGILKISLDAEFDGEKRRYYGPTPDSN